jgi:hypothetical protein
MPDETGASVNRLLNPAETVSGSFSDWYGLHHNLLILK